MRVWTIAAMTAALVVLYGCGDDGGGNQTVPATPRSTEERVEAIKAVDPTDTVGDAVEGHLRRVEQRNRELEDAGE